MCVGVDVRNGGPVTVLLFLIDPVLASVSLVVWAWAAVRAASLSYAPTPRRLARGAGVVLGLVAFGVVLLFARATVLAGLAAEDWCWYGRRSSSGLPLVGVPALAALALAVPRLVSLLRTAVAFSGIDAMPPSLRRDAAHPLVALPVELAAYGAVGAAARARLRLAAGDGRLLARPRHGGGGRGARDLAGGPRPARAPRHGRGHAPATAIHSGRTDREGHRLSRRCPSLSELRNRAETRVRPTSRWRR